MNSYAVGASVEREWQRILEARGHLVTRTPGSKGTGLYDLHSTDRHGKSYLWEIKSTARACKYFSHEELSRIKRVNRAAKRHNIKAFVVVKFRGRNSCFLVLTPEIILKRRRIKRDEPPADLLAHFYCPTCLTRYQLSKPDMADSEPACGYCGTPLEERA